MSRRFLVLSAVVLAGCGTAPSISSVQRPVAGTLAALDSLHFTPVSIEALTSPEWNKPSRRGERVTFQASFGRETWSDGAYTGYDGYKLWDRSGHGIRCANILSVVSKGGPWNRSRDFNEASRQRLLQYGTFVKIEGTYQPEPHVYRPNYEPAVDVWFIDGQPVRELVAK